MMLTCMGGTPKVKDKLRPSYEDVWLGFERADPVVGLLITVAILFVPQRRAAVQVWHRLMDAVEPGVVDEAETAAGAVGGVVGVSLVRPRWIGHAIHAEVRVTVDRDLSVAEAHTIAEEVEHALMHAVPKLASVIVHVDPCDHDGSVPHGPQRHREKRTTA
jgi:divalent metal cation (Fe/Co/Zn/Cd) transporter